MDSGPSFTSAVVSGFWTEPDGTISPFQQATLSVNFGNGRVQYAPLSSRTFRTPGTCKVTITNITADYIDLRTPLPITKSQTLCPKQCGSGVCVANSHCCTDAECVLGLYCPTTPQAAGPCTFPPVPRMYVSWRTIAHINYNMAPAPSWGCVFWAYVTLYPRDDGFTDVSDTRYIVPSATVYGTFTYNVSGTVSEEPFVVTYYEPFKQYTYSTAYARLLSEAYPACTATITNVTAPGYTLQTQLPKSISKPHLV